MMKDLEIKKIKSEDQYNHYCIWLNELIHLDDNESEAIKDRIELLLLVIEKWDQEQYDEEDYDPIQLLKSLKEDHNLSQQELAKIAGISASYMSEIINYKKQLSKKVIRRVSKYFKLNQDLLNRPYRLNEGQPYLEEFYYSAYLHKENQVQVNPNDFTSYGKAIIGRSLKFRLPAEC